MLSRREWLGLGLLLSLGLLVFVKTCPVNIDKPINLLKPQDKEVVLYNSVKHELTIQTAAGKKTEYARNPVIHIQKDGNIVVDRKLYGLEFSPFLGVGGGDGLRVYVGASWLYVWKLDFNTQLGVSNLKTQVAIRAVSSVSYNFWRDTDVFVGVEPVALILGQPRIHAGLSVRF